jgi:hypothetical protein
MPADRHDQAPLAGEPHELIPLLAVDEGTDRHPLRLSNLFHLQSMPNALDILQQD